MREFRRVCVMFSWMTSLGLFLLCSLLSLFFSLLSFSGRDGMGFNAMQCNGMGREGARD